jgi:glycerate kinase
VNGHGIELMETVRQLDEIVAVFAGVDDADLSKPCSNEEGDGDATGTVAVAAAHLVEGYARLGRFLHSAGYVPAAPAADLGEGLAHSDGHRHAPPAAVADVLELLHRVEQPAALLGGLTDEQFDSVPAKANRFADGQRTLRQMMDEMTSHQAAHLAAVKRALA